MVNTSHNNRLNHIEEWSQCTWDAVKAPYLGSIPVVPCGWCSATEQLARNSRYGKQQPKFPLALLRFYTHTYTATHENFKKCLLPEAKAIDFYFIFCFSFPFSRILIMRILNITSEEEGIPDCFQSPPQTCFLTFLFLSFFKKRNQKG